MGIQTALSEDALLFICAQLVWQEIRISGCLGATIECSDMSIFYLLG